MSDISAVGGKIQELKVNVNNESNLNKVFQAAKKDNADNIIAFDQKSQKSYLISKDHMEFSDEMKKGAVPSVTIPIDGKSVKVEVKAVNNQVNSLQEGINNPIVKGLSALGFGTAVVATAKAFSSQALFNQATNISLISHFGDATVFNLRLAKVGLAVGAAALIGGAVYGLTRKQDETKTSEFVEKRVGVLNE